MRNSVFILVFILLSCNSVSKPDVKQMVCQYADGSTITDSILLADIALEVRRLGLDTNNVALIKTKIKGILGSQKNLNELSK